MQDQDSQKNLLIAIVLSMAVLFAWQFFYSAPREKERQLIRQEQIAKAKEQQQAAPKGDQSALPGAPPGAPAAAPVVETREAALASSPRVAIKTPSLSGSIALKGGRIDDIVLTKYRDTVDAKSPNVELFSPSGSPHPYYAEFGWSAAKGATQPMPDSITLWRAEKDGPLTPDSPVTLVWDNGQGLVFRRTISVDPDYLFKVTDEVENKSSAPITLYPYALISRHGLPQVDRSWILHEGFVGGLGGLKEVNYADVLKDKGTQTFKQTGGWLGFTDKYWAAALIPDQTLATEARFSGTKGASDSTDTFQADVRTGPFEVAPGATSTVSSRLFAGAKVVSVIENYNSKLGVPQLDKLNDWGLLSFLTLPLYNLLHWLNGLVGNLGIAILAVTVLVKGLFFPLANKSYASMAKMKLLQPEMERLRARYPDDRAKQQQELMALYREKKINPMAGCLPILVQVPVFFALYKVLYTTIDMRQAPFFGWIHDLSAPDPTSVFNLFGLLPFAPPAFLPHLGVWPIIMGITMWAQMQLNPQQADPMQQKIFNWMPVMFTFLLGNFASGLVIYWAWNNLLSLSQQYVIMKRNGAEIHLWKNMGVEKLIKRFGGSGSGGASTAGGAAPPAQKPPAAAKPAAAKSAAAGDGDGAAAPKAAMTRQEALDTLGLAPGATPSQIEAAYHARARNGRLNGSERLSRAREVLRGGEG
jgi:YidC/Oxa1 family membrane protein insertase